tara:strand:+ start:7590 stop:8387 length:798 start_codon:yes stop_codon:yes gene_type:complete
MGKKSLSEIQEVSEEDTSITLDKLKDTEIEIDVEALRDHSVFFATPCYGGLLTDQYFLSMFRLQQELIQLKIPFRITTLRNESLVTRARNILVAMFLESDCSHLMFIDADIEFNPESIVRLLAMDKDVAVGAYPKKTLPIDYAMNFKFIDSAHKKVNVDKGAVEVLDASTGFFMIKREVLEKMMLNYPELHYKNDSSIDPKFNKFCYAFFDTGIDKRDNRYLSEDYFFCRKWQDIGGSIWLDPQTKLSHVGSYTFEGDVSKILGR